jgi:hypothetical protein
MIAKCWYLQSAKRKSFRRVALRRQTGFRKRSSTRSHALRGNAILDALRRAACEQTTQSVNAGLPTETVGTSKGGRFSSNLQFAIGIYHFSVATHAFTLLRPGTRSAQRWR